MEVYLLLAVLLLIGLAILFRERLVNAARPWWWRVRPPAPKLLPPVVEKRAYVGPEYLLAAKATELGTHFEREDLGGGKFRHTQHLKPIAHLKNGVLRRNTNRLVASGDPNLTVGVDELTQFRIRPRLSGNAPVLHFGRGESLVRMTPLGTLNVEGLQTAYNVWEYPGAWPGTECLRFAYGGHVLRMEAPLLDGHPSKFGWRIDDHTGFDPLRMTVGEIRLGNPLLGRGAETIPLEWLVSNQGGKYILSTTLPPGNYAGWTLVL